MCDRGTPDAPLTEAEFERRLSELIQAARTNEIDIRGWYPIRGLDEDRDWDVGTVELAGEGEDGASI